MEAQSEFFTKGVPGGGVGLGTIRNAAIMRAPCYPYGSKHLIIIYLLKNCTTISITGPTSQVPNYWALGPFGLGIIQRKSQRRKVSSVFLVVEPSKIIILIQDTIPKRRVYIILLYIGYHSIPKQILLRWGGRKLQPAWLGTLRQL